MEIEYVEESRLGVHTIRMGGVFLGMVVHKPGNGGWTCDHEIHQWDDTHKGFTLYATVDRWQDLGPKIKEMVS